MVNNFRKKVLIALSGGMDSAVAAALLKELGFEVAGVFMHFYKRDNKFLKRAKEVAEKLNIPLYEINVVREFKKKVIDYFLGAYEKGLTPNPCVVCNKEIKFGVLLDLLKKSRADYVATGHYAKKVKCQKSNVKSEEDYFYKLLQAKDRNKDQSYFLYRLSQKDLAKAIFPLGDYKKSEVKQLAKKFDLPVLESEESQDICFLAGEEIAEFLRRHLKIKSGDIIDETGRVLGRHKGLPFYTIGQRKGIEIGGSGPYFVVSKNIRRNELVVTNNVKSPTLLKKEFWIRNANWLAGELKLPQKVKVKIRYRAPSFNAIIKLKKMGKYKIICNQPQRAITPGQSAVFYKSEEVLGGGMITENPNFKIQMPNET